ncbi:hypothetical protein [Sphingomonas sp. Mn802worker]|uniref:hypothetical protein n=1 Tax=Sphingomonas sp. Mn802worker TaxID=629773 RepID=UPI000364B0FE|nr:hypothetical protein [Sphingomonas sp. Mn802worker]
MPIKHLLIGAAAVAIAATALAQERPESLLPPGFGQTPSPAPAPTPTSGRANDAVTAPRAAATASALPALPSLVLPSPTPTASPTPDAAQLALYEMPAFARRSLQQVGPVGAGEGGVGADAFGRADGRYLEVLMRRLSAPLPSRWMSIALRRLLASQLNTPAHVNGADFAAERAWLLLRMGESVAARAVAQSVDADNVTPKLAQVWMQTALANADPAGLCTLAQSPRIAQSEPGWIAAQAMCAGMTGEPTRPLVQKLRRLKVASGVDLQLTQKVIGAGADSRQAITIEWDAVTQLNAWRWGLATATGVVVPEELHATVGSQLSGWRALAPAIPLSDRVVPAERGAAMGILSNAALVDLFAASRELEEAPAPLAQAANDLQDAYVGVDRATRLKAMTALWSGAETPELRYARLILTARAAGRLTVFDGVEQADQLIASMLSAGLDRTALRWQGHVPAGSDAWAMLHIAEPDRTGSGWGSVDDYAPKGANASRKKQLFFAAMAGLGRMSASDVEAGAQSLDVRIGATDAWTRALDRAAAEGQSGTVVLLAATGMQTNDWAGVPPAALYRIIGALRAVGLTGEARMIAVEALTRL